MHMLLRITFLGEQGDDMFILKTWDKRKTLKITCPERILDYTEVELTKKASRISNSTKYCT